MTPSHCSVEIIVPPRTGVPLSECSTKPPSAHGEADAEHFLNLSPRGAELDQRLHMETDAGIAMPRDTQAERDQLLGLTIERVVACGRLSKDTKGLHDIGMSSRKRERDLDTVQPIS
jgi:hypothetical protein